MLTATHYYIHKSNFFTMKKILFLAAILVSCSGSDTTPQLDGDKPFIVTSIEQLPEANMAEYFGTEGYDMRGFSNRHPSIILPIRLYNIGDTITITHKKYK